MYHTNKDMLELTKLYLQALERIERLEASNKYFEQRFLEIKSQYEVNDKELNLDDYETEF